MLEQPFDSSFIGFNLDQDVYGPAVVVTPVSLFNPNAPTEFANIARYNKTKNATVKKPFIEQGYELIPQPTSIGSSGLRVDVAGAIARTAISAPGNLIGNIQGP